LSDLTGKLASEEVARKHLQDAIDRARAALPAPWREPAAKAGLREQLQWKVERDDLVASGVEARHKELAGARGGIDGLKRDMDELQEHEVRFAEPARQPPETVRAQWQEAKTLAGQRETEWQSAQQELAILERNRQQRGELGAKVLEIEREHNYFSLLAQLLGRDRLQRHLVRVAERHIVDYANGVLDRLSAGELFLRLCPGEEGSGTDRALDMEACNRTTGGSAINVAFLSGSQRFRVAVSLALGIGRYASRQHRPIESVIIDEGFGCLDRQGRQVMIQELQNLRGHLQCILLVSHQEEFADAFPDGYRFELMDGATRVTRHQR
jgi:DNA repair exonuclease SbcCD ATPase subunit